MDVAITGSSGLIGTALVAALREAGHRPIRMVRREPAAGTDEVRWDPAGGVLDAASLDGVDAVVNLGGAGVGDGRWTAEYKKLLVDSRIDGTALLATTMAGLDKPPAVFLSGSAIGYYGSQAAAELTESSPAADSFLARLTVDWEQAAQPAIDAGIRTAFLRTGIVLSSQGGALGPLGLLFKLGLGGKMGAGDQYMSWISIHDEVGIILHLLENDISGPVNLTAPAPVTNAEFTKTLAKVLGRPAILPVPSFGPKLILGGERADALLFDSARVLPKVIEGSSYEFQHRTLEPALRTIYNK